MYIANKLGAEALGVYSIIMSIYMFCVTLATSGVNLAITKVVSEEAEKHNECAIPKIIKICITYSLVLGIFSCILLIFFTPYICNIILANKVSKFALYILALSLPFVAVSSALSGYFLAVRKMVKTSIIQIFAQFIKIGIITILVSLIFKDINTAVLCLVLGAFISEIFNLILLYFLYLKDKRKLTCSYTNGNYSKRVFKIAIPLAITSYIRSGLHTLKHVLIPLRLKAHNMSYERALTEYGMMSGMALPIIMFPSVIVYSYSSLLLPEFSRYSVELNKERINNTTSKIFKVTLYFSIAISAILMIYGNDIGYLLYKNITVGRYIKLMAPLIVLIYLDNVVDNILKGLGKQISVMCCNILDLAISVSFIYFLLPVFGSLGYIIVLYISEILNYVISIITLFKTTDLKFKYIEWVIFPILLITLSIIISKFMFLNNIYLQMCISIVFYSILLLILTIYKKIKI